MGATAYFHLAHSPFYDFLRSVRASSPYTHYLSLPLLFAELLLSCQIGFHFQLVAPMDEDETLAICLALPS